jgi:hypothetical protein
VKDSEKVYLERSRKALQKTLVGTKIVSMEKRKYGDAKLILEDGSVVMLRSDGECCASASITTISEIIECDHAITHVKSTKDGEEWFIYAEKMTVGSIGVTANEGTGAYGFGITIEVLKDAEGFVKILDASKDIYD